MRTDDSFKNFWRMARSVLLQVGPTIAMTHTNCLLALPVKEKLALTVRFLATKMFATRGAHLSFQQRLREV